MKNFIGGSFIIVVGLLIMFTGMNLGLIAGDSFQHTYPTANEWDNDGTHSNTFSNEDGYLVLNDLSNDTATGVFTSDEITNGDGIEINNIIYEADNIRTQGSPIRLITLQVEGLDEEGVVQESVEQELQNGRYSVAVEELQDQEYSSYRFTVNLESSGSTSPQLQELVISGNTYEEDGLNEQFGFVIQWVLIFLGLLMVMRDVI